MKKALSILLVFSFLLSLCACAKSETPTAYTPPSAVSTPAPVIPEPEPTSAPVSTATDIPVMPAAPLSATEHVGSTDGYVQTVAATAEASSSLEYAGKTFHPEYAADGNLESCWQEGAEGEGVGESLLINFSGSADISLIRFRGGYARDDGGYYANGRPAKLLLEFSDGQSISCSIPDRNDWFCIELSASVTVQWLRVTILEVYSGSAPDTCITEICFYSEAPGSLSEGACLLGMPVPEANRLVTAVPEGEPYKSYIELLRSDSWATDYGFSIEDSSRLEGHSLEELYHGSLEEYLDEYPVNYFVWDVNGDGIDELLITGDIVIGYIENCYFFGWQGSQIVYLGCIPDCPSGLFSTEDGFLLHSGVTMSANDHYFDFQNGYVRLIRSLHYTYDEDTPSLQERGFTPLQYSYSKNFSFDDPYAPLLALAEQ